MDGVVEEGRGLIGMCGDDNAGIVGEGADRCHPQRAWESQSGVAAVSTGPACRYLLVCVGVLARACK